MKDLISISENVNSVLKYIARDKAIRQYFNQAPELYNTLLKAAKRYIPGETLEEALVTANQLHKLGYEISIEFMGEDTETQEQCIRVKKEIFRLIEQVSVLVTAPTICLDLSNIGLIIDFDFVLQNLMDIANFANRYNCTLMISMEESSKTEKILNIYYRATQNLSNIGITLQAHLYRSMTDVHDILKMQGRIRLVKGVYAESELISLSRSEKLDHQYMHLLNIISHSPCALTIATHDPAIISQVIEQGYLNRNNTRIEMLHGVTPGQLKMLKQQGYKTNVYIAYGTEWFLHFCHRLAEYPPNILQAIIDCQYPDNIREDYYF